MAMEQIPNHVLRRVLRHRYELLLRGHDLADLGFEVGLEAHVPGGHDAEQIIAAHHGYAGNGVFPGQLEELTHRRFRSDGDGVANHAALELFHQAHFPGLALDGHVLMDDADAPFLGHGNG